ncbi:Ferredoxin-NADP reductase [Clostridium amylolyticum]|uniref:Ferredoxin-NADP reductase n=1 Tax=Clostridium amylolyticum TaxID=1121298 RepID=A0A1M6BY00_9CLOT|nr:FAD-binding oxidoreductase [Clostridium amylolyticum]SHI53567.1 Ferredoxin-NADP reductase [Clostridium amylolyticum]
MKSMKEIIISEMVHGNEILKDIEVTRKNGKDLVLERNKTKEIIGGIHAEKLELKVVEVYEVTKESKTIRLVSKNGYLPPFQAGQYINIFTIINGVRTSRPYSISSSPKQRAFYEITVARIPTGFVSDYFLDNIKVGDEFEANGPAGTFHFNPVFHHKKSVFLAGGSGITPFMSMSREILESGMDREIYLIYGCRREELAIYHEELSQMAKNHSNFHYTLVISDSDAEFTGRKGFIDAKCIKEIVGDLDNCTFYMCGPQIMTDFCMKALKELKVKDRNIRREMFGSRQDIQNEPGWPDELKGTEVFKVKVGDKVIDAKSSESLLTAIERSGLRINVCCRSGECSLCRIKLVSGNVFMPRGVLLRLADEKFGYIHSCKAYPISDLEIMF